MTTATEIKKGDLFYTSWGYDQTNYDYVVVVSVSKTGKTVKAQRAHHDHLGVGSSGQTNIQQPIAEGFGDVFQLKAKDGGLRGSYPFLHTGKGSKRFGWLRPIAKDEVFHETDSMFGH